jgi:imidazolonepropionase-like amidohydrolase
VTNTILTGIDVLVHGHPLNPITIRLINEHQTLLMPTLTTYYQSHQHINDGLLPDYMVRKKKEIYPLIEAGVRMAVQENVTIVAGSDSGMPYTPFGPSSMKELELLVRMGGMSEMEAITAGTRNAARALNIDSFVGTLEPGKSADLLVLAQDLNPLTDISVLQQKEAIKMVFLRGKPVISR